MPLASQVREMNETPLNQGKKPNFVKDGVGGIDKSARSFFRRIANNVDMSFKRALNTQDGEFLSARVGGKKLVKGSLYSPDTMSNEI